MFERFHIKSNTAAQPREKPLGKTQGAGTLHRVWRNIRAELIIRTKGQPVWTPKYILSAYIKLFVEN